MTHMPPLTLDFFHDVVCGWCFNLSPRLRQLADEFGLDVRHHTFVLQDSPERMVDACGSHAMARDTILSHWAACAAASDTPQGFNIEAMRAAPFNYPHGLPAALACQAAQQLGGQAGGQLGHWRLFDALQTAHLSQARNVADPEVLLDVAAAAGFDRADFAQTMRSDQTLRAVQADRALAQGLGIRSVPTVIVRETGARLHNGPLAHLRQQLQAQVAEAKAAEAQP
ncbi:MAG: DsbA family protein [Hydrogenophaga sp.]|uniref:DsbA family oxidoreductase n=1 Tax=Hydrogenophaga sp. TaxID=1904254 RepID=UPI001DB4473B|nr:DsbA family protein [Hydrogenophaga sp.]MBX3608335.1 DsbA family protein [Hydrogenophaga sp.]